MENKIVVDRGVDADIRDKGIICGVSFRGSRRY